MEGIVFKFFGSLFRLAGIVIFTGTMASVLGDLQSKAAYSHHVGLVSLLSINQQLVMKEAHGRSRKP